MAPIKVLELIAESKISWENATQNALNEASKAIGKIRYINVKNLTVEIDKGKITNWRLNCKITFEKE